MNDSFPLNENGVFVDSKAKRRISKRCFKKKSTPNFPKNKHFLPPDTHTYMSVSEGKKMFVFRKI